MLAEGAYVRVLAEEEIGAALGTCAHLAALQPRRTGAGLAARTPSLEALLDLDPARAWSARLMPVKRLVAALPLDLSGEPPPRGRAPPGRRPAWRPSACAPSDQ